MYLVVEEPEKEKQDAGQPDEEMQHGEHDQDRQHGEHDQDGGQRDEDNQGVDDTRKEKIHVDINEMFEPTWDEMIEEDQDELAQ